LRARVGKFFGLLAIEKDSLHALSSANAAELLVDYRRAAKKQDKTFVTQRSNEVGFYEKRALSEQLLVCEL